LTGSDAHSIDCGGHAIGINELSIRIDAHFTATIEKTTALMRRPAVRLGEATILVGYPIGIARPIGCASAPTMTIEARGVSAIGATTTAIGEMTAAIGETAATTNHLILATRRPIILDATATATKGCLISPGARLIRPLDAIDGHAARTISVEYSLPPLRGRIVERRDGLARCSREHCPALCGQPRTGFGHATTVQRLA
jgi:hypothetical protein